jgi:kojibiose phosphorylase
MLLESREELKASSNNCCPATPYPLLGRERWDFSAQTLEPISFLDDITILPPPPFKDQPKTPQQETTRAERITSITEQEYHDPEWTLSFENVSSALYSDLEVATSLANGALGFRGSLSRIKGSHHPAFYRAGLFEKLPPSPNTTEKQPSRVADLVRLPDMLDVDLKVDGQKLDLDQAEVLSFKADLDLKNYSTTHNLTFKNGDKITQIAVKRFASQDNRKVVGFEYSFTPLNYSGEIILQTGIDGRVDNNGEKYLEEHQKGATENGHGIYFASKSLYKGTIASLSCDVNLLNPEVNNTIEIVEQPEQIYQQVIFKAEENKEYTLQKRVVLTTARDNDITDPVSDGQKLLSNLETLDKLYDKHTKAWAKIWQEADIKITGDPEAQKYLRYCIAKLNAITDPSDEKVSAAAKALDNLSGEGYLGHVFWDTELFMLLALVHSRPEVAKSWLMYRHHTLPAAKEKAKKFGFKGALYSWESADTGEEETPELVADGKGNLIEIHTGRHEFHISADIAYAINEYYKATEDEQLLKEAGAEIMADTARFWASAARYNSKTDSFMIKGVIGPDEYHEQRVVGKKSKKLKPGVHNNTYTNLMARWNIQKALELWETRPDLREQMKLTTKEIDRMKKVSEKMHLLYDPESKLYEQFEGFYSLEYHPLIPGVHAMDSWLKEQGLQPAMYQVNKQPDTPFALDLLREEDPEVIAANYHYYIDERCSSGSSLSDGAIVKIGAKAGISPDSLYPQFMKAAMIDLKNLVSEEKEKGRSNGYGGHAASWGGLIQAVILGFGGLDHHDSQVVINPKLPSNWEGLSFRTRYANQPMTVDIRRDNFVELILDPQPEIIDPPVLINGRLNNLVSGQRYKFSLTENKWLDSPDNPSVV